MRVLLVPPVDNVDHPAVRHLTAAVGTPLSELGDDALHEGTARLFTSVGAATVLLAGPLH
ncbi:hypothetical protein [Streptomyces sp. NPDC020597]|uniref:hypothetical protein n=1 Tax=unclassified Streptomyces TaxID=2593676 RepID=UPI0037AFA5A3